MLKLSHRDFLIFPRVDGGQITMDLKSLTNVPITYKFKTTSPEKFNVKPIAGILNKGESASVTITLKPGKTIAEDQKKDKFLVLAMPVPSNSHHKEALKIWKEVVHDNMLIEENRLICAYNTDPEEKKVEERPIPWLKEVSINEEKPKPIKEPHSEHVQPDPIIEPYINKEQLINEQKLQTEPIKPYKPEPIITYEPMPITAYKPEPIIPYEPMPIMPYEPDIMENEGLPISKQFKNQDQLKPSAEEISNTVAMDYHASSPKPEATDLGLITVTPSDVLTFPKRDNSFTVLQLTSLTHSSITFMIKTTSAEKFMVKPYIGILEPFESVSVTITIKPNRTLDEGTTNDKFLVMAMKITRDMDTSQSWAHVWKLVNSKSPNVDKHRLTCAYSATPEWVPTKSDEIIKPVSEKAILKQPSDKSVISPIAILPNTNNQKDEPNLITQLNTNQSVKKPEIKQYIENFSTNTEDTGSDVLNDEEEGIENRQTLEEQLKTTQVLQFVTLLLLLILSVGFVYLLKKQLDFEYRLQYSPEFKVTKTKNTCAATKFMNSAKKPFKYRN